MMQTVRVTVLVENTAEAPELLAEHGMAFWIEAGPQRILFDTGQGGVLVGNAFRLGVPLAEVDAIVLSHGHYDHTGGLSDALHGNRPVAVYAHPDALKPKYARNHSGSAREIGIPDVSLQSLQRRRDALVWTGQPTALPGGLSATGPVPRATEYEDTGGPFFLDHACTKPDPLPDDQAVFFPSTQGTVVLLGCAHAGVVNTLQYVRALTDGRPIHAVLGGMHLVGASPQRVQKTVDALRAMDVARLGPAHCTGRAATAALWDALPDRCVPCYVGARFEFELAAPPADAP